jgi:hypothetical protein
VLARTPSRHVRVCVRYQCCTVRGEVQLALYSTLSLPLRLRGAWPALVRAPALVQHASNTLPALATTTLAADALTPPRSPSLSVAALTRPRTECSCQLQGESRLDVWTCNGGCDVAAGGRTGGRRPAHWQWQRDGQALTRPNVTALRDMDRRQATERTGKGVECCTVGGKVLDTCSNVHTRLLLQLPHACRQLQEVDCAPWRRARLTDRERWIV